MHGDPSIPLSVMDRIIRLKMSKIAEDWIRVKTVKISRHL